MSSSATTSVSPRSGSGPLSLAPQRGVMASPIQGVMRMQSYDARSSLELPCSTPLKYTALERAKRILGETTANHQESIILAIPHLPCRAVGWMVKWRAKASMARLQSASIDLYQVHWPNPLFPVAETGHDAFHAECPRWAGFLSEVGVSKYSLDRWLAADRALGDQVLTNQVEYSLLDRSPERELIPFARTHGRIIIGFQPTRTWAVVRQIQRDQPASGGL